MAKKPASHNGLKKYDIVNVVTNPRQEEDKLATVLRLTRHFNEDAAVIQYHFNSCPAQTVSTRFMNRI